MGREGLISQVSLIEPKFLVTMLSLIPPFLRMLSNVVSDGGLTQYS